MDHTNAQLKSLVPFWVSGALTEVQELSTLRSTGWSHVNSHDESLTRIHKNVVKAEKNDTLSRKHIRGVVPEHRPEPREFMPKPELPKPWDDAGGEEAVYAILEHEDEYDDAVGDDCEEREEMPAPVASSTDVGFALTKKINARGAVLGVAIGSRQTTVTVASSRAQISSRNTFDDKMMIQSHVSSVNNSKAPTSCTPGFRSRRT